MFHLFDRQGERTDRRRRLALKADCEGLEVRECLSTTVNLAGNTLNIIGDASANNVTVTIREAANDVNVVADGQTFDFKSPQVKNININLKAGDDNLQVQLGSLTDQAATMTNPRSIVANLGDGADVAEFAFGGRGFLSRVIASNLNINVDAGAGDDRVTGDFGEVKGTTLNFNASLGAGNDSLASAHRGNVDPGSAVNENFQGQDGDDVITSLVPFDRKPVVIDVAAGAIFNVTESGGAGNDRLNSGFRGHIAGSLVVRVDGGAGDDRIIGLYDIQSPSRGAVDVALLGGDGNDTLTLNLNVDTNILGLPRKLRGLIDGGAGANQATGTDNVTVKNAVWRTLPPSPGA